MVCPLWNSQWRFPGLSFEHSHRGIRHGPQLQEAIDFRRLSSRAGPSMKPLALAIGTAEVDMNPRILARHLLNRLSAGLTGGPRSLSAVLDGLYESGIALQADRGSRIDLSFGQEAGPKNQASFTLDNEQGAARWLHRTAIRQFPASKYGREHSCRFNPVTMLARRWSPV